MGRNSMGPPDSYWDEDPDNIEEEDDSEVDEYEDKMDRGVDDHWEPR